MRTSLDCMSLRRGTRVVPHELFDTPALDELIDTMRATLAGRGVGEQALHQRRHELRDIGAFRQFKKDAILRQTALTQQARIRQLAGLAA